MRSGGGQGRGGESPADLARGGDGRAGGEDGRRRRRGRHRWGGESASGAGMHEREAERSGQEAGAGRGNASAFSKSRSRARDSGNVAGDRELRTRLRDQPLSLGGWAGLFAYLSQELSKCSSEQGLIF